MKMSEAEMSEMADAAYDLLETICEDRVAKTISKEAIKNHLSAIYLHLQRVEEMYDLQQENIFEDVIKSIRTA
jgi:hypothetical protein